MKDLDCPRMLTHEEICTIDWNEYTVEQIDVLISCGSLKEEDIIHYYNNKQWRDEV